MDCIGFDSSSLVYYVLLKIKSSFYMLSTSLMYHQRLNRFGNIYSLQWEPLQMGSETREVARFWCQLVKKLEYLFNLGPVKRNWNELLSGENTDLPTLVSHDQKWW